MPSQPGGRHFVRPKPGKNGGVPGALDGKRLVLTGTFPELGGGASLNIGKDRMKVRPDRSARECPLIGTFASSPQGNDRGLWRDSN